MPIPPWIQGIAVRKPVDFELAKTAGSAGDALKYWSSQARKAGWTPDEIARFWDHAIRGSQDDLLEALMATLCQPGFHRETLKTPEEPPSPSPLPGPRAPAAVAPAANHVGCPKCGSTQVSALKKGFGIGKSLLGGFLAGPVGLLGGFVGSRKVYVACAACGHTWTP